MGQLVMEWLKKEPTELQEYLELCVLIFFFGIIFAGIGRLQLGNNPGDVMFRRTLTVVEHGGFAAACKMALFVVGEECIYRYYLQGEAARHLESDWLVLASAVPISVLFAVMPPHNVLPGRTRAFVALGGFILSLLYLKCGGWHDANPRKALLFVIAAHLWVTGLIAIAFVYYREK